MTNLELRFDSGRRRWTFTYVDFWKKCRKHRIESCSCTEFRMSRKTWPEADIKKAEEFTKNRFEKFFRLKGADCARCGDHYPFPYELCPPCSTITNIRAGRLKFVTNWLGNPVLVPVPYQEQQAVTADE